jgi:hypothetical protein
MNMIIKDDILSSGHKNIVFCVDVEGKDPVGFAEKVAKHCPELQEKPLVDHGVLRHFTTENGVTFHAITLYNKVDSVPEGVKIVENSLSSIKKSKFGKDSVGFLIPQMGLITMNYMMAGIVEDSGLTGEVFKN